MKKSSKRIAVLICAAIVLALAPPVCLANSDAVARLPDFSVSLNGIIVDNLHREWPLLVSGERVWFPMTYYDCGFLGVETYSRDNVFYVEKTGCSAGYREIASIDENEKSVSVLAGGAPFSDIIINGQTYKGQNLFYKYMLYLPLDEIAGELGWTVTNVENGLDITGSGPAALPFELPREIYRGYGVYRTYNFPLEDFTMSERDDHIALLDGMLYYTGADGTLYRCPLGDCSAEEKLMTPVGYPPHIWSSGYRVWVEGLGYYDAEGTFHDRSDKLYDGITVTEDKDYICYGLELIERDGRFIPIQMKLDEGFKLSIYKTEVYGGRLYYYGPLMKRYDDEDGSQHWSNDDLTGGSVDLTTGAVEEWVGDGKGSFANGLYYTADEETGFVTGTDRAGNSRIEGKYRLDGELTGAIRNLGFGEFNGHWFDYRLHIYSGNGCVFAMYDKEYDDNDGSPDNVWWFHSLSGKYLTPSVLVRLGENVPANWTGGKIYDGFEYRFESMRGYNVYTQSKFDHHGLTLGRGHFLTVLGETGATLFTSIDDAGIAGGRTANIDRQGNMLYRCREDGKYFLVKLPAAEGNLSASRTWNWVYPKRLGHEGAALCGDYVKWIEDGAFHIICPGTEEETVIPMTGGSYNYAVGGGNLFITEYEGLGAKYLCTHTVYPDGTVTTTDDGTYYMEGRGLKTGGDGLYIDGRKVEAPGVSFEQGWINGNAGVSFAGGRLIAAGWNQDGIGCVFAIDPDTLEVGTVISGLPVGRSPEFQTCEDKVYAISDVDGVNRLIEYDMVAGTSRAVYTESDDAFKYEPLYAVCRRGVYYRNGGYDYRLHEPTLSTDTDMGLYCTGYGGPFGDEEPTRMETNGDIHVVVYFDMSEPGSPRAKVMDCFGRSVYTCTEPDVVQLSMVGNKIYITRYETGKDNVARPVLYVDE